ncbi:SMI1/KNR4 family protein [Streptomyces sp. NPDC048279]|uniref:SMI1/KNR4 family protein n=1 Tax=Streptomyces sp. NPDC048279 TaxID=3154714 RepID=UPI003437EF60
MTTDAVLPSGTWNGPSVRSRVAAMAREDPQHHRFGASHHGYRLHPPLPETTIRSFEQLHRITLPASYRDFLSTVADGGAGPHYGLLGLTDAADDAEVLHDLRAECLRGGFLATPFPHTTDRPGPGRGGDAGYSVAGTLVLGEIGCGAFSRLVITGRNAGQVWLDDPSWGGLTPGADFHAWYTAWLACLQIPGAV